MDSIENKVADTILQKPFCVQIGEETYKVAKNCIANIITLQTFCLKTEVVNEEQKETRYYSIN